MKGFNLTCVFTLIYFKLALSFAAVETTDLQADYLEFDIKNNVMIATKNVIITDGIQTLMADTIYYHTQDNILHAEGNVTYINDIGEVFQGETLSISSEFNMGIFINVLGQIGDGNTLKAKDFTKESDFIYRGKNLSITSCSLIAKKTPTWEIQASQGIYNNESEKITLYNTLIRIKNVPVFWIPILYISTSKERAIGFLSPSWENHSALGNFFIIPFYIPVGDSVEMILEGRTYKPNPLLSVKLSGYSQTGSFDSNFGYTKTPLTNLDPQQYHYFFTAKNNLNSYLRSTIKVEQTSDIRYLKIYDINPKNNSANFLTNHANLEGFFGYNHYMNLGVYYYKDLNPLFATTNEYETSTNYNYLFISNMNKLGKIKSNFDISSFHKNSADNSLRTASNINYQYLFNNLFGIYILEAQLQGSYYRHQTYSEAYSLNNGYLTGSTALTWEYLTTYNTNNSILIFGPKTQLTLSKEIESLNHQESFDAQTPNLTLYNLYSINHYSGYDKYEEARNLKLGLKSIIWSNNNIKIDTFLGRIIHFKEEQKVTLFDENNNILQNIQTINDAIYFQQVSFKTPTFTADYKALTDKYFNFISNRNSISYNSSLFSIGSSYSLYNNLDPNIYSKTRLTELSLRFSASLNRYLKLELSSIYNIEPYILFKPQLLTVSTTYKDDCLEASIFFKTDLYSLSNNKIIGVTFNIKNLTELASSFSFDN